MSIWRRFHNHGYPSLITTNIEDRRTIFSRPEAAQTLVQVLEEVQNEGEVLIHAYAIMPDHLHLVVSIPPDKSLSRTIQLIKGRFAWRYNRDHNRDGKVWQSRFHESALLNDREFYHAIEHVHNNPLVAGLVPESHLYRWSSAASQLVDGVRPSIEDDTPSSSRAKLPLLSPSA